MLSKIFMYIAVITLSIFCPKESDTSKTLSSIAPPKGYTRVEVKENSMGEWLRNLPLKESNSKIHLYTGEVAPWQSRGTGVIDMKLLSNAEQCADVTMHLRAEYLFQTHQYHKIRFITSNHIPLQYLGLMSKTLYKEHMKLVFKFCNTESLVKSLDSKDLSKIEPGDILVYKARPGHKYGHAILVADVAVNKKGEKMILCVEGNTPSVEMHIVNSQNSAHPQWVKFNDKAKEFHVGRFRFNASDLKSWE